MLLVGHDIKPKFDTQATAESRLSMVSGQFPVQSTTKLSNQNPFSSKAQAKRGYFKIPGKNNRRFNETEASKDIIENFKKIA